VRHRLTKRIALGDRRRRRVRLYSLDVNMPAGAPHGLSFVRMLEYRRRAPLVIFITGDPGMAAQLEFKGRAVLAKPIDFALLRRAVAAV
jgi:DNA-binding LytR/AlgR family response regulator